MTATPGHTDTIARDAEGRIAEDVACLTCGYNLRSRMDDDACPECGAAVRATLGRLLRNADPKWLGRIEAGSWMLLAAGLLLILRLITTWLPSGGWPVIADRIVRGLMLAILFFTCLLWLVAFIRSRLVAISIMLIGLFAFDFFAFDAFDKVAGFNRLPVFRIEEWLSYGLFFVAAWLFSSPQPDEYRHTTVRMMLMVALLWFGIVEAYRIYDWVWGFWPLVWYSRSLAMLIALVLLVRRGASLAHRLPARRLARCTRVVAWGIGASTIGAIVVMQMVSAWMSPIWSNTVWMTGSFAAHLPMLAFVIWAWILLLKFTRRLRALTQDRHPAADHSP